MTSDWPDAATSSVSSAHTSTSHLHLRRARGAARGERRDGSGDPERERRVQIAVAAEVFDHFAVADRLSGRPAESFIAGEELPRLFDKPRGEHGIDPGVNPCD